MWRLSARVSPTVPALASLLLLVVVVWLYVRAQFGSNDYLEWKSKDQPVPGASDAYRVPLDDPRWAEFSAKFEQRERRRWLGAGADGSSSRKATWRRY